MVSGRNHRNFVSRELSAMKSVAFSEDARHRDEDEIEFEDFIRTPEFFFTFVTFTLAKTSEVNRQQSDGIPKLKSNI